MTLQAAQELQTRVRQTRAVLERMAGEARAVALQGQQVQADIVRLKADQDTAEKVTKLLTTIGEQRQNAAQAQLEGLVTRGLQTIFTDELTFHVVQEVRSNRAEVDFIIRSTMGENVVETPVMEARGGGLAAVVGFLVRLVVMLLSADRQRPIMFLDETFANVSAEYEPRLAEFIREIVNHTPVQIVLVTHSTAFSDVADRLYHFSQVDGETRVREGSTA
jgi:DNA repair exonuclease SbcCD ATPase subunit